MSLTAPTVRQPRPRKPKVTPTLREQVFTRDGACVAYILNAHHICRDQWGTSHSPFALHRMSLEHVHTDGLQMGLRAPSDPAHMLTLCYGMNLKPPSKEDRAGFRKYLEEMR